MLNFEKFRIKKLNFGAIGCSIARRSVDRSLIKISQKFLFGSLFLAYFENKGKQFFSEENNHLSS
jgi:hypothetical protein